MNLFPVNGGLLNGGVRLVTVAAAASFSCVASFSATPTRVQDALAPYSGSTQFVASAQLQQRAVAALSGTASLHATAFTTRAASAHAVGSANLVVYVLRGLDGEAFFSGQSEMQVIPASVLGTAQPFAAAAQLYAEATKEHPGIAGIGAAASVTVTAEPLVNRYGTAQLVSCTADFYAETNINGVDEAYSNLVGSAGFGIYEIGLVTKLGEANVVATATVVPESTHNKNASAAVNSSGSLVSAEASIEIGGIADLTTGCSITVWGTSIASGIAEISNLVDLEASASIEHGSASAVIQGSAQLIPDLLFTSMASSRAVASAQMVAQAVAVRMLEARPGTQAQFTAVGLRTAFGVPVGIASSAEYTVTADTTIREGEANAIAGADFDTDAVRRVLASSDLVGIGEVVALAERYLTGSADFEGFVTLIPDSFRNPFAVDPPERTFYRTPIIGFASPKRITEFRRPA